MCEIGRIKRIERWTAGLLLANNELLLF